MSDQDAIEACILRLCKERGQDKTICPSEAARALANDNEEWRAFMPEVRAAASGLADRGVIEVTQKGKPVDPETAKGPIRLGIRRR